MATKYWVGGGSSTNWNATSSTNWANSSGGAGNQTAPGTGDVAVFDGASGTGNSVLNTAFTIQGLECDGSTAGTGTYGGTITHNASTTLTINTGAANSFRLTAGMTYTPVSTSSLVTFTHTTGTASLKSAGKRFGALTINGNGGTTQLVDALRVDALLNSQFILTTGNFDANGQTITAISFQSAGASTRSLTLGGDLTIGGNATAGNIFAITTSGMTFTKNSSNIIVLPFSSSQISAQFSGGGITFNDLTLQDSTSLSNFTIASSNTFAHLNVGTGWAVWLPSSATQIISNAFTWVGTPILPIGLFSSGTAQATISVPSGACSLKWGMIDNIIAGGGATFTATNTFAGGVNAGWSISPPADATSALTAAEITTLGKMIDGVSCGTVTTGASTTSVPTSALSFGGVAATGIVADEFKGRVIQFSGSTTTAGLRGATSAISANTASNTPTFTVATLPATPASGDIFCVI